MTKEKDNFWSNLVDETSKEASKGGYLKLQPGDNKIRVVGNPISGYIDWDYTDPQKPNGKPVRSPLKLGKPVPLNPGNAEKQPKIFWAMEVYDYATESIKIWEVASGTIREKLEGFIKNSDYGPLTEYNLTINKTGSGLTTKYEVIPSPPKPAEAKVIQATMEIVCNLEALYDGGDPFATMPK